jgi:hypothetical protein
LQESLTIKLTVKNIYTISYFIEFIAYKKMACELGYNLHAMNQIELTGREHLRRKFFTLPIRAALIVSDEIFANFFKKEFDSGRLNV